MDICELNFWPEIIKRDCMTIESNFDLFRRLSFFSPVVLEVPLFSYFLLFYCSNDCLISARFLPRPRERNERHTFFNKLSDLFIVRPNKRKRKWCEFWFWFWRLFGRFHFRGYLVLPIFHGSASWQQLNYQFLWHWQLFCIPKSDFWQI